MCVVHSTATCTCSYHSTSSCTLTRCALSSYFLCVSCFFPHIFVVLMAYTHQHMHISPHMYTPHLTAPLHTLALPQHHHPITRVHTTPHHTLTPHITTHPTTHVHTTHPQAGLPQTGERGPVLLHQGMQMCSFGRWSLTLHTASSVTQCCSLAS